jgi:2-keto-4-pentenoate hydratase/2-oxohepta-3-ene-1,7-dioic acid hydratase in catechol pathway
MVPEWFPAARTGSIVCIGYNYPEHVDEGDIEFPKEPIVFGKFENAICWSEDDIVLPAESSHVDCEAELAVIIGATARRVDPSRVHEVIAGYTCGNDVTARDIVFGDSQWARGKSFDTFCPLGPRMVAAEEVGDLPDLAIVQRVNGEMLQAARTSEMIFGVRELVAYVSRSMTLKPGDVILTGTPPGVGYFRNPPLALAPGDEIEVEIEGIGILRNRATAAGAWISA